MLTEIKIRTSKSNELINITSKVEEVVFNSKVKNGLCGVYCPHTTAGIIVNENSDPDVVSDLLLALEKMVPKVNFKHQEGNSSAHLKSTIVGIEKSFVISAGVVKLGTWQGIFFAEFDGPRERKVLVNVIEC
jgi:secondary thiamine-phosphate synthase enzyme